MYSSEQLAAFKILIDDPLFLSCKCGADPSESRRGHCHRPMHHRHHHVHYDHHGRRWLSSSSSSSSSSSASPYMSSQLLLLRRKMCVTCRLAQASFGIFSVFPFVSLQYDDLILAHNTYGAGHGMQEFRVSYDAALQARTGSSDPFPWLQFLPPLRCTLCPGGSYGS